MANEIRKVFQLFGRWVCHYSAEISDCFLSVGAKIAKQVLDVSELQAVCFLLGIPSSERVLPPHLPEPEFLNSQGMLHNLYLLFF